MDKELVAVLYEEKLKKLLVKFLQPDFEIKSDTSLNILLSHLSGKDDKELGETLINLSIFKEWLFKCLSLWDAGHSLPPSNIIAFAYHITSLLSRDETNFKSFNDVDFYRRLFTITNIKVTTFSPLVQLAYIKLLTAFLQHNSGTNWLIAGDNWIEILNICLKGQTVYIVREGQNFMYELLAASGFNQTFCNMVVDQIMLVIKEALYANNCAILEVNDESLEKRLMPSLMLIGYILESHLQSDRFAKRDYSLPLIFVRNLDLEQDYWSAILAGIRTSNLVYELNRVMILINFFKIAIECPLPLYEYKENQQMITFILKVFKQLILKYDDLNIVKIGCISQWYWKLITPRLEKVLQNRSTSPIIFDHQVIIFQIFPIIAISYKYCNFNMEAACETGSFRDKFITKLFGGWSEDTVRLVYEFRRRLEEDPKNIFEHAQKSFMYVMKSRSYLQREPAILALEFFIYILKDITRVMMEKRETVDIFMKNTGYLMAHFEAIAVFILEFDITWQESIETILIMSTIMKFINLAPWNARLIVQILKLVNLLIARFTTPNLALLTDRTSDLDMINMGPLLTTKLHDTSWEVRDSALEVFYTICTIAHTKFPSFQCLILEHDLPSLIVIMGLNDSESFVRASALKCVKEMVQVRDVWEGVLKQEELPEKMLQLLYNETEAIVRCEAASVITAMYEHQLLEPTLIDSINRVMVIAATSDLHWEVKLTALCYWNRVIENRLIHQGMIDGDFPTVTFSSELKKIIALTTEEIRNRLMNVLTELSQCGCLTVLVAAVQDECDIEVSKKALEIIKKLLALLEKNGVTYSSTNISHVITKVAVVDNKSLSVTDSHNLRVSDDVIDEIVNTRDVQLLPHVYLVNGNNASPTTYPSDNTQSVTSPQDFLNFVKTDLDALINQRTCWLNNIDDLDSLLDDMLRNYDVNDDTNAMDCY